MHLCSLSTQRICMFVALAALLFICGCGKDMTSPNLDDGISNRLGATEAAATGPFLQENSAQGIISIEAEHFSIKTALGGKEWLPVSNAGYSGEGAMSALPNNGAKINSDYTTKCPRMDYQIQFVKTGKHYIWTRAIAPTGDDDSYHAGLDASPVSSCDRISSFQTSWTWSKSTKDGPVASIDVATAGIHTVNVWMREDGLIIDKIVITTDANFTPSENGPPESPHVSTNKPPTVATAASVSANPVTATTTDVSVLGSDDGAEADLIYSWEATTTPVGGSVDFPINNSNAAKNSVATFKMAGSYVLTVTIKDKGGLTVTSTVPVVVDQAVAKVLVTPDKVSVPTGKTQQFTAKVSDQFGMEITQPPMVWQVKEGGTVDYSGLFTAGEIVGGPFTINAISSKVTGSAEITITAPNNAPTVATAASASTNPVVATTTDISVLGSDDGGEADLIYKWVATKAPEGGTVDFTVNNSNAAKNTVTTFKMAGSYDLSVTIEDKGGLTVTSSVSVMVNQTITSILVIPTNANIPVKGTHLFAAKATDQFGKELSTQPTFTWDVSGGGTVDATGLFTAEDKAGGPFTISATSSAIVGTAQITVTPANNPPTIATPAAATPNPVTATTANLTVLGSDDGAEPDLIYTWAATTVPNGGTVTFSPNTSNAAKNAVATFTMAGAYVLTATIQDKDGLAATSNVSVTVNQTVTAILVTPADAAVAASGTQQFAAKANDQFGKEVSPQPSITWSVSGGGTIAASGLFTAGASAGGPFTVTATGATIPGTAQFTVTTPSVVIYDDVLTTGYAHYSWGGTYNFSDASPVKAGSASLSIIYTMGWGGLQIQKTSGTQTFSGFTSISFWAHGGAEGTRQCQFFTRNNAGQESKHVNVNIPANTWTLFSIPISALGNPADAKTIMLQECSGKVQPEFNIDLLQIQ